jgi:hypothetical protein
LLSPKEAIDSVCVHGEDVLSGVGIKEKALPVAALMTSINSASRANMIGFGSAARILQIQVERLPTGGSRRMWQLSGSSRTLIYTAGHRVVQPGCRDAASESETWHAKRD